MKTLFSFFFMMRKFSDDFYRNLFRLMKESKKIQDSFVLHCVSRMKQK